MFVWKLEVILPFTTNLPRDVAVNVFYVAQGGAGDVTLLHEGVMDDVLPNFYVSDAGTSGALSSYISRVVSRVTDACTINAYEATAHGVSAGAPVTTSHFTMGDAGTDGFDLPNQIAAAASLLSTHNGLVSGTLEPLKNRRGRLYLGPLRSSCLSASTTGLTTFAEVFTTSVCDQARQLATILDSVDDNTDASGSHFSWGIGSARRDKAWRTHGEISPIGRGSCDNRIDTQRRRQEDATHASTWSISGGTTP